MRLQFGILESFDGPTPQNDTVLAKIQHALENERARFLQLKQRLPEEREQAFREGYGLARDEVSKMTKEDYAARSAELTQRLCDLEAQNTRTCHDLSDAYSRMTFDILQALLPECCERAVNESLFRNLADIFLMNTEAPLVLRACHLTAGKISTAAAERGMRLPEISIDENVPEGDFFAERGALRYQGSYNEFLTSAVQCLRRYLTPDDALSPMQGEES